MGDDVLVRFVENGRVVEWRCGSLLEAVQLVTVLPEVTTGT